MEAELRTKIAEFCKWAEEIQGSTFDPAKFVGPWKDEATGRVSWIEWVDKHHEELKIDLKVRKAEAYAWLDDFKDWFISRASRYYQPNPELAFDELIDPADYTNDIVFLDLDIESAITVAKEKKSMARAIRSSAKDIGRHYQRKKAKAASGSPMRETGEEVKLANVFSSIADYASIYFGSIIRELSFFNNHKTEAWRSVSAAVIKVHALEAIQCAARKMCELYSYISEVEVDDHLSARASVKADAAAAALDTFCILKMLTVHQQYKFHLQAIRDLC